MNIFVNELIKIAGVSEAYAVAAWYTMPHATRNPTAAAHEYNRRYF